MSKIKLILICVVALCSFSSYHPQVGTPIDELNGILVMYNGNIANVFGRNVTDDGYNLGLKYQCVEFIKRYYYEYYDHKMPESYGHAKDFFNQSLEDKQFNKDRGLVQFRNTRNSKPLLGDIIVFGSSQKNPYGHMAIVSEISKDQIEIIQQNWGLKTRQKIKLVEYEGIYTVAEFDVLGWLRMPDGM